MNKENAIEVRNLYKSFKVQYDKAHTLKDRLLIWTKRKSEIHEVLKNISLNIKKGETVALIGTNGSGKSTLLKLMTKIIYPNSGTVQTNGKLTSLLELGAGFHQDFTGRENIYFNASIFGLTRKEIEGRIQDIIDFSELGEFIDNPIRTYSSGMYMRLAFSVAINVDADILLIDEILAVGDQHFQEKCYAKLEELRDSGKTIVIVTHSLGVVKELCHRAIWIYKGEFKLDGDPAYVIDEYLKQSAIDHKELIRKQKETGEYQSKAIINIDSPRDLAKISKTSKKYLLRGWLVTDESKAKLKLFLNQEEIGNVEHEPRPDVYDVYYEQFPGSLDPNTLGWKKELDLSEMEEGNYKFTVSCYGSERQLMESKEIDFTLEA